MTILEAIHAEWAFTGLAPRVVLEVNAFGHALVQDVVGQFWQIVPDLLLCERLATSEADFRQHIATSEFQDAWKMERLVALATAALGTPGEGRCFCLKIPAAIGGVYEIENIATIAVDELIGVSGNIAAQIRDLPDGTPVEIKIID
jgi:hypothetical protein